MSSLVRLSDVTRGVLDRSLGVKAGQRIWIHGWEHTLELVSVLGLECRRRGCHVLLTVQPEDLWWRSLTEAPLGVMQVVPAHLAAALRETDAYIFTLGPRRPVPWREIPAGRRKIATLWLDTRYDRSRFARDWARIASRRKVRMVALEATLATPERAKALGLDYRDWRDVMWAGCAADWPKVRKRGKALERRVRRSGEVTVTSPHGTRIGFRLDGRPVKLSDGLATRGKAEKGIVTFLPAGGIEVTAREDSADGVVVYDLPIHAGTETIDCLTLTVRGGRIVDFSAKRGSGAFERYLEGKGDVDRFAFFGFGLNPRLRFGFTQDDKTLGSTTIGFGDNERKGGKNRAGGADWWGAMTRASVTIDGETVMRRGTLVP